MSLQIENAKEKYVDFMIKDYEQLNQHLLTTDSKVMTITGFFVTVLVAAFTLCGEKETYSKYCFIILSMISLGLLVYSILWIRTRKIYINGLNEIRKKITTSLYENEDYTKIWDEMKNKSDKYIILKMSYGVVLIYFLSLIANIVYLYINFKVY